MTPGAHSWTEELRTAILERGWEGFEECCQHTRNRFPEESPQTTSLDELRNYLGNHVSHMNYAERLQEGRSIGSGQVEARAKT